MKSPEPRTAPSCAIRSRYANMTPTLSLAPTANPFRTASVSDRPARRIACLVLGVTLAFAATAAPASVPTFDGETLRYSINWPSGLSLGEAQIRATRVKPTPKSAERYDFEFSIDAAIPGFTVADRYHSEASPDFCSINFDKLASHGKKKADEKTNFDPQKLTATRETKDGGKSDVTTAQCAKDALAFLFYVRRELAQGRLVDRQPVYFGAAYEVRLDFAGTQTIRMGETSVEVDRLNGSLKGPSSELNFEAYFLKDAARTLALVKVPLAVGTFSMELVK